MGMMDMFSMISKAKELQTRIAAMQKELANETFSGSDSGNNVTVRISGTTQYLACEVKPGFAESAGSQAVGYAVTEASNNAMTALRQRSLEQLTAIRKDLGLPDNFELPF